jgi:putative PIN family toxin of toxin-antitoxin system
VVKKKVVLDTNVLISSLLKAKSKARDIYRLVLRREIELYASAYLINELSRVLEYPKFKFEKLPKKVFLKNLTRVATILVNPRLRINVIEEDPPDNKFLECAVEAKADYFISGGNRHFLPLKNFQGIKIISSSEFLRLYQKLNSKHS